VRQKARQTPVDLEGGATPSECAVEGRNRGRAARLYKERGEVLIGRFGEGSNAIPKRVGYSRKETRRGEKKWSWRGGGWEGPEVIPGLNQWEGETGEKSRHPRGQRPNPDMGGASKVLRRSCDRQ